MAKSGGVSWLKELITLREKYGTWKIIIACLTMLFVSYVTYLTFNPSIIFERYNEYEEQKHTESFQYRIESTPLVQDDIEKLRMETSAMRAFIIEMHNGKYNSAGLSFTYGSLTYESVRDSIEPVSEDYSDFSLERFPCILKLYNSGYWSGTIDDLAKFDKKMALRLESNGVYYIIATNIYGIKDNIGFIGITFAKDDKIDEAKYKVILSKYASKVSPLLDGENAKKK